VITLDINGFYLGAGGRIRTPDLLITNQLLYRLSYTSIFSLNGDPEGARTLDL
jgi:hypothetical protein